MKDWIKTVIWVLVGFCMISVAAGIFNIAAFLQMIQLKIYNFGINDDARTLFTVNSTFALLLSIACVAITVVVIILSAKSDGAKYVKPLIVLMIIVFAISLFFLIYSYGTLPILEGNTKNFTGSVYDSNKNQSFIYNVFVHYQTYLSSLLSTFLPLMIADGLLCGYLICIIKQRKRDKLSQPTETQPQ